MCAVPLSPIRYFKRLEKKSCITGFENVIQFKKKKTTRINYLMIKQISGCSPALRLGLCLFETFPVSIRNFIDYVYIQK